MNRVYFALAAAVFGTTAFGQHGGDIALTVEHGRIRTGTLVSGAFAEPARVFESEFGEFAPNFTDEPGFDCAAGTFPVPSGVGFRVRRALREWDGSNFNSVSPIPIEIDFGPFMVRTPATDQVVEGFILAVAGNGQWHRHFGFTLAEPATDGVYLLELELFSTAATIEASEPFWIVFNQNEDEPVVRAAENWVKRFLAGEFCLADFDDGTGGGEPDGGVTIDDLLFYLGAFDDGARVADVDDGSGQGVPDGGVTIDDLLYFLARFDAGC